LKRIVLPPEFRQLLRSLPKVQRKQIGQALTELERSFGQPHQHRGLGVRPLRNDYYELRLGLNQRLVFSNSEEGLVCELLGNHDEVKRFLKSH
jgi:mRNA-degrading endonuclease RelE of RelBE toxin-antitoxin system